MAETNISIVKGNTVPMTITVMNGTVAQNITGYTFYFTAKTKATDTDASAVLNKTITSLTNPTLGIMTITLTATETAALIVRNYFYDIVCKSADTTPVVTTLFYGTLSVIQNVRITK